MARWLDIRARHRRSLGLHASLTDFTAEDAGQADPDIVRSDDTLSLYCLDHARRQAVFVWLPSGTALADASFVYARQYEAATGLLSMPYSEFLDVAGKLPEVDRFVMVYMTGRSGSTLLSHALNRVAGVLSLSEPDVPVGLVHVQRAGTASRDELRALFDASVRLLFRRRGRLPGLCVLKMRSESIQLADLIRETYPGGSALFLYRDAVGWVGSMYRIFMRLGLPALWTVAEVREDFDLCYSIDADRLFPLLGRGPAEVDVIEYLTVWWLAVIEEYLDATERGLDAAAFRYEDISGRPQLSLPAVFRVCGLPEGEAGQALAAWERDSQSGTQLSQAAAGEDHLKLTPAQAELITSIVARHPRIRDPAIVVPGTVRFP
jgi:hypothetical protein